MSLIVQDFGGLHNNDYEGTMARLTRGKSWKKQRIICVLPAANAIASRVYLSHVNLIYPPNNGLLRMLALGQEVGEAYCAAIENVLAHPELSQWEYLLTLEHDNAPPQDGVLKLLESLEAHPELAAVGGLYFTKGPGGVAQIWGDPADGNQNFRPLPPRIDELVECNGTGMGFTIFRLAMFKDAKLRKPWFKTVAGMEGVGTQDLYAWSDFRKNGYRCAVDCRVRVGHWDEATQTMW